MEKATGRRVKFRYRCRLQDGKGCQIGDGDTMEAVIGAGAFPPSLEGSLASMQPGERREVTVPYSEVRLLPLPRLVESVTPPGVSYDFGPGDAGDVGEMIPPRPRHLRDTIPPGADLYFDIEMLSVEESA